MPAMSSTMKEGRVVEWLKSEGEPITAGESIATIESDKVRHTQCNVMHNFPSTLSTSVNPNTHTHNQG